MKHFSIFLFLVFFSAAAFAKCATNGIYLLSGTAALNKNGLIVLEFYASSQELIKELNKKNPIYLFTKNDKVPLLVIEIFPGEYQLTQVVLKPSEDLIEGEVYELKIDHLPEHERLPEILNKKSGNWEVASFKINSSNQESKPELIAAPTEFKKTFIPYGCGPERWVYFKITEKDQSGYFLKARVKNKSTGKTTEYLVAVEDGQVRIGHGMCSGSFNFDGENFEASFKLFKENASTTEWTKSISFKKPQSKYEVRS